MKKPFNLEEALAGKPVVTREGEHVLKVVSFLGVETDSEYLVWFATASGICSCYPNGKQFSGPEDHYRDLFMEVEDEVVWINFHLRVDGGKYIQLYPSKELADSFFVFRGCLRIGGKAYKVVLDGGTE